MTVLMVLGIIDIIVGLTVGAISMLTNDSGTARVAVPIAVIMALKGILSVMQG